MNDDELERYRSESAKLGARPDEIDRTVTDFRRDSQGILNEHLDNVSGANTMTLAFRGAIAGAVGGSAFFGVGAVPGAIVGAMAGVVGGKLFATAIDHTLRKGINNFFRESNQPGYDARSYHNRSNE